MTELRTLKDLLPVEAWNYEKIIRAEAVKWVKEIYESEKEGLSLASPQRYFKSFFNLTEEDLKE